MNKREILKLINNVGSTGSGSCMKDLVGTMSLQVVYELPKKPTKGLLEFYKVMQRIGLSDDEVIELIKAMQWHTDAEVSDHLNKLINDRKVTPGGIGRVSLLSGRYLRQVCYDQKHLSRYMLFALCLFLELSKEEIQEFFDVAGIRLDDSIPDVMFKRFIDKEIYRLGDYALSCKLLAKEAGVTLDSFFDKIYSDETYKDI